MSNSSSRLVEAVLSGHAMPSHVTTSESPLLAFVDLAKQKGHSAIHFQETGDMYYVRHLPKFMANDTEMYSYVWDLTLCGHRLFKVGVTRDVHSRMRSFMASLPPSLASMNSAHVSLCNHATAYWVEEQLLGVFANKWAGGEWILGACDD